MQTVIVTLGGDGALLVTKNTEKYFETKKVNPVDTTAAGDSFTAALALALGEGKEYGEAIQFGNVVSRIVVTRKGAQTSIPTMEEVIEIMKEEKENEKTDNY
ncbi:PfkB family carbohydrate kinase [Blautia sp.]|uniref:PfkB family carbohydrate kinase n=1 Tax=Blautia sp. TaxID=1955243 RepID=UPI002E773CE2|nr:PfkB family carbohydrate kinase [Blautia sp.]MEE0644060.1 PfkB family carbohydrate kinase [Blautia sp.]